MKKALLSIFIYIVFAILLIPVNIVLSAIAVGIVGLLIPSNGFDFGYFGLGALVFIPISVLVVPIAGFITWLFGRKSSAVGYVEFLIVDITIATIIAIVIGSGFLLY